MSYALAALVGIAAGIAAVAQLSLPQQPITASSCTATGATRSASFAPTGIRADDAGDDRDGIQRALDAASAAGGGIVRLPEGTFLVDRGLTVPSDVALEGSGAATVVKAGPSFLSTPAPSGGYPVLTTAGAVNATIAHLTVDQSGDTLDGRVPDRLSGYLVEIRRSTNAMVDDVHTRNPFTYSIAVAGSSRFCVRRSSTLVTSSGRYDQLDGIHVLDSSDGQIIDNVVDQRGGNDGDDGLVAHSLGAPVRNVTYAGNKVRGGTHGGGLQIAAGDEPIQGLVIKDNEFWGSPFGIRTGQYDHGRGSIHDITIEGNNIHDLVTGSSISGFGNAVEITDSGASLPGKIWNVVLRFNRTCRAGSVVLPRTSGNLVSRPRGC